MKHLRIYAVLFVLLGVVTFGAQQQTPQQPPPQQPPTADPYANNADAGHDCSFRSPRRPARTATRAASRRPAP